MKHAQVPLPVLSSLSAATLALVNSDAFATYAEESSLGSAFVRAFSPVMARGESVGDYDAYLVLCRAWRASYDYAYVSGGAPMPELDAGSLERVALTELSQKALERRFERALKDENFGAGAKRPVSQSDEAKRKRQAREAAKALPEGTVQSWMAKGTEAAGKGDLKGATEAYATARKIQAAIDADAKKKAADRVKPLRDQFAAQVKAILAAPNAEELIARAIKALAPIAPAAPAAPAPIPTSTLPPAPPKGTGKVRRVMHEGAK